MSWGNNLQRIMTEFLRYPSVSHAESFLKILVPPICFCTLCHELEQGNTVKIDEFWVDVCVKYNISPEIAEMSREKISIP